jgi:hypothetical protein
MSPRSPRRRKVPDSPVSASRVVARGQHVAVVVYLDDTWGTLAVYHIESATWLLCRAAEYKFRLDHPAEDRLTRAVVRDVCRAATVDRSLVSDAVMKARLVHLLTEVQAA